MQITLTPMRRDDRLTLAVAGEVVSVNGVAFDLSAIPEGATLPLAAVDCAWLASDVERIGGEIHLTLILPQGTHAPAETLFPAPVTVTADGPVPLPPYETELPA